MTALCAECAHWIYGYPRCDHDIVEGSCSRCGWDGSTSDYVEQLKSGR